MQNNHSEPALRILHLEDNAADRELIAQCLMDGGTPCEFLSAANEVEYRRALSEPGLDLILSDFSLPGFSGMTALSIAKKIRPEVPFLFVSGTIGEDCAAETLNAGARDYVLKDRLERLPSAIRRAVEQAKQRAERLRTAAALRESEERFRQVTETMEEVFWLAELTLSRRILYVSPAYTQIWGQPREQLYNVPNSWLASIHPSDRARIEAAVEQQSLGHYDVEYRIVRADGMVRWINGSIRWGQAEFCYILEIVSAQTVYTSRANRKNSKTRPDPVGSLVVKRSRLLRAAVMRANSQ